jgi:hypothetical protein
VAERDNGGDSFFEYSDGMVFERCASFLDVLGITGGAEERVCKEGILGNDVPVGDDGGEAWTT